MIQACQEESKHTYRRNHALKHIKSSFITEDMLDFFIVEPKAKYIEFKM